MASASQEGNLFDNCKEQFYPFDDSRQDLEGNCSYGSKMKERWYPRKGRQSQGILCPYLPQPRMIVKAKPSWNFALEMFRLEGSQQIPVHLQLCFVGRWYEVWMWILVMLPLLTNYVTSICVSLTSFATASCKTRLGFTFPFTSFMVPSAGWSAWNG